MKKRKINTPVIAIDGPAGAGSTTVTAAIGEELGFNTLYSGSLYRTVGALLMSDNNEVGRDDIPGITKLAKSLKQYLRFEGNRVLYDNEDITEVLRDERIAVVASHVAKIASVRAELLDFQLSQRKNSGLVAEGRNMCWIFKDELGPVLRIFLTATAEARARRRCMQLRAAGEENSFSHYGVTLRAIRERDTLDEKRTISPLAKHPEAILIDSTHLSAFQVSSTIISYFHQTVNRQAKP